MKQILFLTGWMILLLAMAGCSGNDDTGSTSWYLGRFRHENLPFYVTVDQSHYSVGTDTDSLRFSYQVAEQGADFVILHLTVVDDPKRNGVESRVKLLRKGKKQIVKLDDSQFDDADYQNKVYTRQ